MLITSLENKKIKFINSLKNSKKRRELGFFIVEGMHLVQEAYKNNKLEEIILLEDSELEFSCSIEPTFVTFEVMKKITSLNTPSSVIGICKINNENTIKGKHILILDGVQDPGNLGTIIRSCSAFEVDTLILSNDTVDIYNEKVIRSTQGMIFQLNFVVGDLKEIIDNLKKDNYEVLGTDVLNGVSVRNYKVDKFALIMGNEGNGVSEEVKKICDKNVHIKMNPLCESLNVGVATSIILYEFWSNYE